MRRILGFSAAVLLLYTSIDVAGSPGQELSMRSALAAVPRAELPAKVCDLIQAAASSNRLDVTLIAVKTAIRLKGSAAPAIVGAAVRTVPELAAEIAETAVRERPRMVNRIAKAAAAAAPSQAGRIVIAVCRAVPADYRGIVLAVVEAVPDSRMEILEALGVAFPEFKRAIQSAIEGSGGKPVSVAGVLDAAALSLPAKGGVPTPAPGFAGDSAGGNARVTRPPFIPLSGRASSQTDPGPGRNYATP